MKMDLELIRRILLRIEEKSTVPPQMLCVEDFLDLCDNVHMISLHISLLVDMGYIVVAEESYINSLHDYDIVRLTAKGYEYLENVRNDYIWKLAKDKLGAVGGRAAVSVISDLAQHIVRTKLGI